jgi:hypothetical protein
MKNNGGKAITLTKASDGTMAFSGGVSPALRAKVGDKTADAIDKAIKSGRPMNAGAVRAVLADAINKDISRTIVDFGKTTKGTKGLSMRMNASKGETAIAVKSADGKVVHTGSAEDLAKMKMDNLHRMSIKVPANPENPPKGRLYHTILTLTKGNEKLADDINKVIAKHDANLDHIIDTNHEDLLKASDMVDRAIAMKPVLDARGKEIAAKLGIKFQGAPVKGMRRMMEKTHFDDKDKEVGNVKDMVRGSFLTDDPADLPKIIDGIAENFKILPGRVKDRMDIYLGTEPVMVESGYRDIMMNIEMPDGSVGEIQIHFPEMRAVVDAAHEYYEIQRQLDNIRKSQGGVFTAEQEALYDAAVIKQEEIYHDAWDKSNFKKKWLELSDAGVLPPPPEYPRHKPARPSPTK